MELWSGEFDPQASQKKKKSVKEGTSTVCQLRPKVQPKLSLAHSLTRTYFLLLVVVETKS